MCTFVYISSKHFFSFLFFFQSKSANVLAVLGAVASEALDLTGFYYSGKPSVVKRRLNQISRTSTGRYAIFISASILGLCKCYWSHRFGSHYILKQNNFSFVLGSDDIKHNQGLMKMKA